MNTNEEQLPLTQREAEVQDHLRLCRHTHADGSAIEDDPRQLAPSDAPTPETDAGCAHRNDAYEFVNPPDWEWVVPADFARRLERERNQWKESCFKADEICLEVMRERDEARAELARLKTPTHEGSTNCHGCGVANGHPHVQGCSEIGYSLKTPHEGSAVEWVREHMGIAGNGTTKYYALDEHDSLELARRCDAAQAELDRLQHENTAHRLAWENAEAEQPHEWLCTACNERGMPWTHVTYQERHEGCGGVCISVPVQQAEATEMRKQRDMVGKQVLTLTAEINRLRKGLNEIKAGTRIGWFMTDLGVKCEKLLNP